MDYVNINSRKELSEEMRVDEKEKKREREKERVQESQKLLLQQGMTTASFITCLQIGH